MKANNTNLDLNLLRVFFAIWDLRNLTAAGDRLGLTQPAISHALRRLREHFGDPLFVRVGNRMLPTDAAVRLHEPLDRAFELLNRTLQSSIVFDPRVSERTFRIAMSDIAEFYLLPSLVSELSRVSPLVRMHVVPLQPETLASAMRSGEIDVAIGAISIYDKELISIDIIKDRYICLVRADHPIAKLKLKRADLSQLRFFFARTTSSIQRLVEQSLTEEPTKLQIVVRGHFTVAPEIVRCSDLVALFPRYLAVQLNRKKEFGLLELPFELPEIQIRVHSHARFVNDSGIKWMAQTCANVLRKHLRSPGQI